MSAMGNIKQQIPVIDPQTRKVVGNQPKDINKVFPDDATVAELCAWARSHNSHGIMLLFESQETSNG